MIIISKTCDGKSILQVFPKYVIIPDMYIFHIYIFMYLLWITHIIEIYSSLLGSKTSERSCQVSKCCIRKQQGWKQQQPQQHQH